MSTISLRRVVRRYGERTALDVGMLDITDGKLTVLLGPSGCGKTTLLRMVAGLDRPDGGEVLLGDQLLASGSTFVPPERRDIGLVFQDHALFPHLRVEANIGFGLPRSRRAARVAEMVELIGLHGLERRYPHELSGGQQQRVALARALAPAPSALLLDEPFSGLDAETRVRLRGEVTRVLRAAGATALLVTHDREEALSMADVLLVMRDGKIVQRGAPADVYGAPAGAWAAGFLGDIDLLDGTATGGVVRCELGALTADVPDGDVQVGLRPEALGAAPTGETARRAGDTHGGGVTAELDSVEFFGHDLLMHCRTATGTQLRVRLVGPARDERARQLATLPTGSTLQLRPTGAAQVFAGDTVAAGHWQR